MIGVSPLLVRASELGPVTTAFWRVALALPLLALWWTRQARRAGSDCATPGPATLGLSAPKSDARGSASTRTQWAGLALAGALFAADLAIWHTSLGLTSIANSTFLVNMAPLLVTTAAWTFQHRRPDRLFLLAMAISFAGALLLMQPRFGNETRQWIGDLVALGAAFALAGYMMTVSRLRFRHSTAKIMLATSMASALLLWPLALASGEAFWPTDVRAWAVLLALAVACHAGGQGLIAYSLIRLPAAFSTMALLIEPVVAAALAWWLFSEAMGPLQMLGGAAILAGIALAGRGKEGEAGR